MSQVSAQTLIERIHASPTRIVLAVTGGGSQSISRLCDVPGASRTMLAAFVPYSEPALSEFLGGDPEQSCSVRTARAMAMAGFLKSLDLSANSAGPVAAIGSTASLISDRPKRGDHRVHVAIQTDLFSESWSVSLQKGERSRSAEEKLCANLLLNAIARGCGIDGRVRVDRKAGEKMEVDRQVARPEWTELLVGRRWVAVTSEAVTSEAGTSETGTSESGGTTTVPTGSDPSAARPEVLFAGAFNPLHDGHRRMAQVAEAILSAPTEFEMSVVNIDKPPLDFIEIAQRLRHFGGKRVWLTRAATFSEKSKLFPNSTFLVGVDTMKRIIDLTYYGNDSARADAAYSTFRDQQCRFLVFGRQKAGRFEQLSDLTLPAPLRELCDEVPAHQFRDDVSSSKIRQSRP